MDKDGKWYDKYEEVEDEKKGRITRSHFPPDERESASQLSRWYIFIIINTFIIIIINVFK